MTAILKGENVSTKQTHSMNFEIPQGKITTIIGPSGSGKSTLIMLLNRMADPLEGIIYFRGKNIKTYPVTELRQQVGMVFQEAHLFSGTVEDNVKFGPELTGNWHPKLGEELMKFVQLPVEMLSREANELSGGQQQRVAFARTLANDPEVLILDEATSALDNQTEEMIEEELLRLVRERNKTIVMITHDLNQARRLGSYTLFISNGRICEQGDTEQLFTSPTSKELAVFLEVE